MLAAGARGRGGSSSSAPAEPGFTLIEIVVAMFLFVTLVVIMASYYPKASLSGAFGGHQTFATLVAQEQVEELKAKTFSFATPTNFSTPTTFTQAGITYTRTVTIARCAGTTTAPCPNPITATMSPNLTIVTVTVTWQEPSTNSSKTVTLTTVVHNYF